MTLDLRTAPAPAGAVRRRRGATGHQLTGDQLDRVNCTPDSIPYMYPDDRLTTREKRRRADTAKAICEPCPVKDACLRTALQNRETWGVWGGVNFANIRERKRATRTA